MHWPHQMRHKDADFSPLYFSEEIAHWLHSPDHYCRTAGFSVDEVGEAFHLVRAYLWRVKHMGVRPFVLTTRAQFDFVTQRLERERIHMSAIPFEQFVQEMRTLTFVDKAMRTLENIAAVWAREPKTLVLPNSSVQAGEIVFGYSSATPESGLAYAADPFLAPHVYEFLIQEGYLKSRLLEGSQVSMGVRISPKGFVALDQIRKGKGPTTPEAFLVRRFDPDLDTFLNPVMLEVEGRLNCPIKAVWDKEHNERIDERIFRLIREAAVIVVDVSPTRFNVGLELGYALALGKPIVVVREKPKDDDPDYVKKLPFDIQTLNCYDYDRSNPQELVDKLVARIGIALDTLPFK